MSDNSMTDKETLIEMLTRANEPFELGNNPVTGNDDLYLRGNNADLEGVVFCFDPVGGSLIRVE